MGAQYIESMLERGAENAKSTKDLLRLANVKNIRRLREMIALERKNGALILSKRDAFGGYFLPSIDPDKAEKELTRNIEEISRSARDLFVAIHGMRQELKRIQDERR